MSKWWPWVLGFVVIESTIMLLVYGLTGAAISAVVGAIATVVVWRREKSAE